MRLFVVTDRDRWGYSINVVRAESRLEAMRMVSETSKPELMDVEELRDGKGILWCYDESPDTND